MITTRRQGIDEGRDGSVLGVPELNERRTGTFPPSVEDRAASRRSQAEQLAAAADGDRHRLEELRAGFLSRLHRNSADFEATEGLRTVELALSMTPRPAGLWAGQRRGRPRERRWWHRRKVPDA